MSPAAIASILAGLAEAIPKLVKAIKAARKAGRDIGSIRLDEYMSTDALESVRETNDAIDDFIKHG